MGKVASQTSDREIINSKLAITQNWFVVFDANAVHLGKIEGEISRQVITVYALLKSLIEEYSINNQYLEERDNIKAAFGDPELNKRLSLQGDKIRTAEKALKSATDELFELLDKRGIRTSNAMPLLSV